VGHVARFTGATAYQLSTANKFAHARRSASFSADHLQHGACRSALVPGHAFGRSVPKLTFLRFPLTEAVMDAARAGLGVVVLSEWMASGYLDAGDLVIRRLASDPLRRPWRIAYRREAALAAERLAGVLANSAPRLRVAAAVG